METAIVAFFAVGAVALFGFLAVAAWSEERRKEREAFYRSEVLRKLIENPGASNQQVLEMLRDEENRNLIRRREGLKIGGIVTAAAGLGIAVFLMQIEPNKPIWFVGTIPLLIGGVLALYAFLLAPRPKPPDPGSRGPAS
jgi:hypothetical protein